MHESCEGAFGIPELMLPIRQRTYIENLHAPAGSETTVI